MKKTNWQLFTTLFATTLVTVLLMLGTSFEQAFPQATIDYQELVAIPPRSEINQGLTSPDNEYMTSTLGLPSTEVATEECSNTNVKPDFNVTEDVGPFNATGYKPTIEALKRIFAKVEQDIPDLYSQLGISGMLCFRNIKGSSSLSNHSWGTAIDININKEPGDYGEGVTTTQLGQLKLYPYFHEEGFYWGAGFSSNVDPMHFEASQERIAEWTSPGYEPTPPPPPPAMPPYQSWLLQTGTSLGEISTSSWEFISGDYNRDGTPDLIGVLKNGTGTKSTEVHVLDGASNYQSWLLQTGTPLGEISTSNWQFMSGDYNRDGTPDLIGVLKNGTGTKSTEVHVLDGASNYQSWLLHAGTPLHETFDNWEFVSGDYNRDGTLDIIGVKKRETGTQSTEIHILNGATNYQDWLLQTGTPHAQSFTNWEFLSGDYNKDSYVDIIGILKNGTGTQSTEVHILNGATNYQDWLLHTGTPLHETSSNWEFVSGDRNRDGYTDIIGINKRETGTKSTEVHILSAR